MIHYRCRDDLSLCLTESAQRMLFQEKRPCLLPSAIISPGSSAASEPITTPLHMILTKDLTLHSEFRASGIAAGSPWFIWHF